MTSRRKRPSTRVSSASTCAGRGHRDRVLAEVRQAQVAQQQSAVGVRIRAHAPRARRRERRQLRRQARRSRRTAPPADSSCSHCFEQREVLRVAARIGQRHLVRAERPFDPLAVDDARAGPALRRGEHDHRPARPRRDRPLARAVLDVADILRRPGRASPPSRDASTAGSSPSTKYGSQP